MTSRALSILQVELSKLFRQSSAQHPFMFRVGSRTLELEFSVASLVCLVPPLFSQIKEEEVPKRHYRRDTGVALFLPEHV